MGDEDNKTGSTSIQLSRSKIGYKYNHGTKLTFQDWIVIAIKYKLICNSDILNHVFLMSFESHQHFENMVRALF